jgi:succinoglycan biosynthesis protein ExoA
MTRQAFRGPHVLERRRPRGPSRCDISIIIPVRNEAKTIPAVIEQIYGLDHRGVCFEVLVIDGLSTDGTAAIVERLSDRYPNLRLLSNPRRLASAARNLGVGQARGDLIVIVDGHCTLDNPRYLKDLIAAFRRSGADCLGRPQPLEVPGASPLQRAIGAARASRLGHHPASFIYSAEERFVPPESVAVAYRRSVFRAVGLFDESFDACEDVEFNHRVALAGLRCYFTPELRVGYHPRSSLNGLFRQLVRYGRGRYRLLRKHPDTFSLASLVPLVFVIGLALGPVLAWCSTPLALCYGASLLGYALTVALASLAIALRRREPGLLVWLPIVFATIHLGAGTGILIEAVAGPRRRPGAGLVAKSSPGFR